MNNWNSVKPPYAHSLRVANWDGTGGKSEGRNGYFCDQCKAGPRLRSEYTEGSKFCPAMMDEMEKTTAVQRAAELREAWATALAQTREVTKLQQKQREMAAVQGGRGAAEEQ